MQGLFTTGNRATHNYEAFIDEASMAKTLIDVDEQQLAAAAQVLNTQTKKDTVNAALRMVTSLAARRRDLERLLLVTQMRDGRRRMVVSEGVMRNSPPDAEPLSRSGSA